MTASAPRRLREYNGPISRGARWERYRPRRGDIIISAPAKSGMTWLQAICAMLIFGRTDLEVQPARLSPWFDSSFEPLAQMLARLEAQTHRRYLKTHTPLDGLPFHPEVFYLGVYRHPLDAFYSMAALNLKTIAGNARAQIGQPPDIRRYVQECIRTPFAEGIGEQLSVASVAQHLLGFWQARHVPNVHLMHYADLSTAPEKTIAALAAALEIPADERLVSAIAGATQFAQMQESAAQFAPESRTGWKTPRDFFRGGGSGAWQGILSGEDLEAYASALEAALPDAAARHWLERGGEAF